MVQSFENLPAGKLTKEVQVSESRNPRRLEKSSRLGVSPNREWLSYAEATELVGLGRTTLWKLASTGEIEVARVGRGR